MHYFRILAVLAVTAVLFAVGCKKIDDRSTTTVPAESSHDASRLSAVGINAAEPAAAAAPDGRVFVAYVEKDDEGDGDLYIRRFDAGSDRPSEPVRVNTAAKTVRSWQGDPPTLAVGPNAEIYVGWTAKYPNGEKGTILNLSVSKDGGATFGEPVKVNDDVEPASHGMHSLAVAADGSLLMAWLDERYLHVKKAAVLPRSLFAMPAFFHHTPTPAPPVEPDAELYFAVSKDGGRTFEPNQKLDAGVCPCCKTFIAVNGDGGFAVGYRKVFNGKFRHIAVINADANGKFAEPIEVSNDQWELNACPVSGPALRFADGKLMAAWYSGGKAGPHGLYAAAVGEEPGKFAAATAVDGFERGGTPVWAGTSLVWSGDGTLKMRDAAGEITELGKGTNPAAAAANGRIVYAFVEPNDRTRTIRFGIR